MKPAAPSHAHPVSRPSSRGFRLLVGAAGVALALLAWDLRPEAQGRGGARGAQAPAAPVDPCAAPRNKIIAENCKPGNPSTEWDINGWGDPTIQGFAADISYNIGETAQFKVLTDSAKYRIDIYRTGYYNGLGARLMASIRPSATLPQRQPECAVDWSVRQYDCGTWAVSASWQIPADATSGVYVARLVREDGAPSWRMDNSTAPGTRPSNPSPHAYGALGFGKLRNPIKEPRASHIIFIVRDDAAKSEVVMQTADPTWVAYNPYGLGNTYSGTTASGDGAGRPMRAHKASYNRPFFNRTANAVNQYFNAEYALTRWLERNGYDTSYIAGADTERRGALLKNNKLFISVGHDEYWSMGMRRNVEAARDAGTNLAFMSGNEVFWKVRYEDSIDGSKTPYRTVVVYKETHSNQDELGRTIPTTKIDPMKDVWTGTWRESSPANPEGAMPENALTGTIFTVNANRQDPLIVPGKYAKLRMWRNTDVAKLQPGEQLVTGMGMLGHEWDEDLDNGFRPTGQIRFSETKIDGVQYPMDHGSVYDQGSAVHNLVLYRAKSGALVFGTGAVQYTWGLDNFHDNPTSRGQQNLNPYSNRVAIDTYGPSKAVQQLTVNIFADMGIQPSNLQKDLVPATRSTDRRAPVTKIVSPAPNAVVQGPVVTISGTATDVGGLVAGIEISTDNGATWHPAEGTDKWTYAWTVPAGSGSATILTRGSDDTVNIEVPGKGVTVQYGARPTAGQQD
ncbi:MAG: N,N-dimethylformamidase beta subunit family domain-containing protein [Vicinamibacterales bacterium]